MSKLYHFSGCIPAWKISWPTLDGAIWLVPMSTEISINSPQAFALIIGISSYTDLLIWRKLADIGFVNWCTGTPWSSRSCCRSGKVWAMSVNIPQSTPKPYNFPSWKWSHTCQYHPSSSKLENRQQHIPGRFHIHILCRTWCLPPWNKYHGPKKTSR